MDIWEARRMSRDDVVAQGVKARMVASKHESEDEPVLDVTRYPEPDDAPDPRAQWDEIEGVWEVWNDQTQNWDHIGEPLGARPPGLPETLPADLGAQIRPQRPSQLGSTELEMVRRGREGKKETSADAHRFPEPDISPDPRAQWNEIEGVWEIWSDVEQGWVDLGEPLAPGGVAPDGVAAPAPTAPAPAPASGDAGVAVTPADPRPVDLPSARRNDLPSVTYPGPNAGSSIMRPPPNEAPGGYAQPSMRPDPHAQWDSVEGIWRVWDPDETDWMPWRA